MKTVKQCLLDADVNTLVEYFMSQVPVDFLRLRHSELTVNKAFERTEQAVRGFIEELKALPSIEDEEMVFLATEEYIGGSPEIQTIMVSIDELKNKRVEQYGWMVADREELLGFHVAETPLTQDNLYTVLAQILEEASFLGFSKEVFEEKRDDLQSSLDHAAEAPGNEMGISVEEMWDTLGYPRPQRDSVADELIAKVTLAELAFADYCRERELEALRLTLQQ